MQMYVTVIPKKYYLSKKLWSKCFFKENEVNHFTTFWEKKTLAYRSKNMPSSIIEDVVVHIFIFHCVFYIRTYIRIYVFIKAAILESST